MSAPNLTRDQAVERAAVVAVQNYRIELDLTDQPRGAGSEVSDTFGSKTTVSFTATPGASTYIDLVASRVRSAVLNGVALDVSAYDEIGRAHV